MKHIVLGRILNAEIGHVFTKNMTSTGESPAIIKWINMPGIDEQAVNLRGGDYLFQIEIMMLQAAQKIGKLIKHLARAPTANKQHKFQQATHKDCMDNYNA